MRLLGMVHRSGDQLSRLVANRDETLCLGVLHEATNQLLSIVVHPTGEIHVQYGPVTKPIDRPDDSPMYELGRFNDDGTLDLHQPTTHQLRLVTPQE